MPVPLVAVAAFCVTTSCSQKKSTREQFLNGNSCVFLAQARPQEFIVGGIDMSQFIKSSLKDIPAVTGVSVQSDRGRIAVNVTVNDFGWSSLQPIYEKEIDLSRVFKGHALDFRVIDESPYAGEATNLG
jgi:hypothetical protein